MQIEVEFLRELAAELIVVGAGPVGLRVVQEFVRRRPGVPVVIFGDEPRLPYNRVRLSSYLAGEFGAGLGAMDIALPADPCVQTQFGCGVAAIDPARRSLRDARGRGWRYRHLVLALGSRPHVPAIPGIELPGVYTFRSMRDAEQLAARRVRSRHAVVIGGGLLGLETARAMRRFRTTVSVIEHAGNVMARQLDARCAEALRREIERLGLRVHVNDSVTRVLGATRVEAVQLRGGAELECDTLIVAAGIRPHIDLARDAGIAVGRGIRVDDGLQTSADGVYAVGECAEHREQVSGTVAPGYAQAAVLAHRLVGGAAQYVGSQAATRLKVLDVPVFSIGAVTPEQAPRDARRVHWQDGNRHRTLVLRGRRLIGAAAVGEWDELSRTQEAVLDARALWPWQASRFARTGRVWPRREAQSVAQWPEAATVCNCTGVTRGRLSRALAAGCANVEALAASTGASTVCGSCKPLLAQLVGVDPVPAGPVRGFRQIASASLFAVLACVGAYLAAPVPYVPSIEVPWRWDVLWRDSLAKQLSGFSLLGLAAIGLLISPRKRWAKLRLGDFALWRLAHVLLGAAALVGLYVHTGGRFGSRLDLLLSALFSALILVGALAAGVLAFEHRLAPARATRVRTNLLWAHLLLFWGVPVLLTFHVVKAYYF
jgi:nitrite reductase (NADH) large subunit